MSTLSRLMHPLRRAAQAVFKSDVTLRRGDTGVRIILADRLTDPMAPSVPVAQLLAEKQKRELDLMLRQLGSILDEMPENRATLRHLVFVEQALKKKGLRALKRMPIDVLKRSLEQFEGLVSNWSPEGLANLRSKMAVMVIARETESGTSDGDGPDSQLDSIFDPQRIEAVLDAPRLEAERALAEAREAAFADSTIERLALEFGVPRPARAAVELQGELDSPSARALLRMKSGSRATSD